MNDLRALLASGDADFRQLVYFLDKHSGPGGGISDDQLEELLTWAVQHLRVVRGLSEKTVAKYVRHVVSFIEFLHRSKIELEDAKAEHVERWQKDLYLKHRYSPMWRRNFLVAVRQFYAWREQMGRGPSPAVAVRGPKISRRLPRKYTDDELRRLFQACGKTTVREKRNRAFLALLYATGARREEMQRLSLDQIEIQTHVARLRIMGKGSKERIVPFEGAPVQALRAWLTARDELGPLPEPNAVWITLGMENRAGGRMAMQSLVQMFRAIATKARIKRQSLHAMRVTFATDLYDQGEDLETIRVLMGHEGIETTRRYMALTGRSQTTRLSGRRVSEMMGEREDAEPLWLKLRLEQRRKMSGA